MRWMGVAVASVAGALVVVGVSAGQGQAVQCVVGYEPVVEQVLVPVTVKKTGRYYRYEVYLRNVTPSTRVYKDLYEYVDADGNFVKGTLRSSWEWATYKVSVVSTGNWYYEVTEMRLEERTNGTRPVYGTCPSPTPTATRPVYQGPTSPPQAGSSPSTGSGSSAAPEPTSATPSTPRAQAPGTGQSVRLSAWAVRNGSKLRMAATPGGSGPQYLLRIKKLRKGWAETVVKRVWTRGWGHRRTVDLGRGRYYVDVVGHDEASSRIVRLRR